MALHPVALIARKKEGGEHPDEEIRYLIDAFQSGEMTDYQMTAWLMAAYLRGLSDREMVTLTESMLHSGKVHRVPPSGRPRIDKHSTGGVGDKISLPLAPIAAVCGAEVPMIAGRGLGHTGGTLDKLESIPGYNTRLSMKEFDRVCREIGTSIIGPTEDIAPADRRIYALRDVTSTVACRPLIVASILSKKLAAGLSGLVLDVKVGRGAFMQDKKAAKALAKSLVMVAGQLGTPAVARLTSMDEPLGTTIGNALEIKESVAILRGEGPADTTEITLGLVEDMLLLGKLAGTRKEARRMGQAALQSGQAFERFKKMVELHGGDPRVIDHPERLPKTKSTMRIVAERAGIIQSVDPLELALLSLELGAGRFRAEDSIDHAVGIEVHRRVGDRVGRGDLLLTLHVRKKSQKYAETAAASVKIGAGKVAPPQLLLGREESP